MSPKRAKSSWKQRGVQKWILGELQEVGASTTLSTSKIAKRIAKSSAKRFHKNSVYTALRMLVRRGDITAVQVGHEKAYRLAIGAGASRDYPTLKPSTPAVSVSPGAGPSPGTATPPDSASQAAMLPHKLALGEILVLSVGDGQVLAATNLHGRLVLERHALPA
jgi:hypothetical protein